MMSSRMACQPTLSGGASSVRTTKARRAEQLAEGMDARPRERGWAGKPCEDPSPIRKRAAEAALFKNKF